MPLYYNQKLSKPWPVSADSPFPLHWAIWHSASATDSSANQTVKIALFAFTDTDC